MIELADFENCRNGWTHFKKPGEKEGRSLYTHNGALIADVRYEEHCTFVFEHEGIYQHDCLDSLQMPDGNVHFVNKDGKHYASKTYKNNQWNGPAVDYSSKGWWHLYHYKNDKLSGLQTSLRSDATPFTESVFVKDVMQGLHVQYDEEGKNFTHQGMYFEGQEIAYGDNLLDTARAYHEAAQSVLNFFDRNRNEAVKKRVDEADLRHSGRRDNKLYGRQVGHWSNGKLFSESYFVDDVMQGLHVQYDEQGKNPTHQAMYFNGKEIAYGHELEKTAKAYREAAQTVMDFFEERRVKALQEAALDSNNSKLAM